MTKGIFPFDLIRRLLLPLIILLTGFCLAHTQETIAYVNQIDGVHQFIATAEILISGSESSRSVASDSLIIFGLIYILVEAAWFMFEMAMVCLMGLVSGACWGGYMLFKLAKKHSLI